MASESAQQVKALGQRFAQAQTQGDTDALDQLLANDFKLVGPLGFVLDKDAWLSQFRSGALVVKSVSWEEVQVRDYGAVAIAIGRQTQQTEYQGRPAPVSELRVTQVLLRDRDRWVLAGLHFSPIAQGS